MGIDSGVPAHWPFDIFDPAQFKIPERVVHRLFVHCSAWDGDTRGPELAATFNQWHLANGWRGIGYHYVVDNGGVIVTGRPLSEQPAAQLGKDNLGNVATIAICTNGLWNFREEALHSTFVLVKAIVEAYDLAQKPITVHGHCELDPKPCPVYDYKSLFGLDDAGNFGAKPFMSAADVLAKLKQKAADPWHHT